MIRPGPGPFTGPEMNAALGLLCVVHRDGGHYAMEHGLTKAFADAQAIVVAERARVEEHGRVHVLYHGLPLCCFTGNVPGEWPPGHKWVSAEQCEFATCRVCKMRGAKVGRR